ncbi:MAG: hypothetical protein RLZZ242_506 [Bacteroidota bacterium]|jgi:hypothetical protein
MKFIQRLTLLSSITLLAVACDLQQTFDERIDDKQLLVLTPDFADTSVQLVFRDPETLAVLDEDFEVTVYANKRLVDLNGNYKNEFIARGGVMEFSVSPEETVSESDPLEISVYALSKDQTKIIYYEDVLVQKKGFNNVPLTQNNIPDLSEIEGLSQGYKMIDEVTKSVEEPRLELSVNGRTHNNGNFFLVSNGYYIYRHSYFNKYYSDAFYVFSGAPEDNTHIAVFGPTYLTNYDIEFFYRDQNGNKFKISFDDKGLYSKTRYYGPELDYKKEVIEKRQLDSFNDGVTVPSVWDIQDLWLFWHTIEDYAVCKNGFYVQFEGLESGDTASLLYRGIRNFDNKAFMVSAANINTTNNSAFSLEYLDHHIIGTRGGHRLEFAGNSQYIIEPQVIELGGEELCGNTYTVRLKRRDTFKKHQINLSMRNESQNVGLALTFSALLRKQGQSDAAWESVNFKQGSTSVYLEEGSTYEVKLTLADEPFEFTFTNDLSLVEAAVQATKRNVTRIKDINYRIEQSADMNTINAEIVFFEGQSLID